MGANWTSLFSLCGLCGLNISCKVITTERTEDKRERKGVQFSHTGYKFAKNGRVLYKKQFC